MLTVSLISDPDFKERIVLMWTSLTSGVLFCAVSSDIFVGFVGFVGAWFCGNVDFLQKRNAAIVIFHQTWLPKRFNESGDCFKLNVNNTLMLPPNG